MKRHGNIYEKILDMDNLITAHRNARRGKAHYTEVKMVDSNEEFYLRQIQQMLRDKTYKTSDYTIFTKVDKRKEREIYKLPYFPDRIVHHAIMNQLEPFFMSTFIYDTYAAMPGRGIHMGIKRLHKAMKDRLGTRYCLKLDVKKFFPSVNHDVLKQLLSRKFKDKDLLWLLYDVIDSVDGDANVPIGNYLSQYFCNFYLSGFDHWIKETRKERYYFRYMDDMVILSHSKQHLHDLFNGIRDYLQNGLCLQIKENYQVFPTYIRGVDFLGYRSFGDYALLRKTTAKSFKRKMRVLAKKSSLSSGDINSIMSYKGWLMWCNAYHLERKFMHPLLNKEVNV